MKAEFFSWVAESCLVYRLHIYDTDKWNHALSLFHYWFIRQKRCCRWKQLFYHKFPGRADVWKSVVKCKGYLTEPDFALGSRKSVYFRRVCTTLPGTRNFSKHEPCGLSVWQCADWALLQYLKDRADLSVSFWNCSRTGLCRFRVCLRLVQSDTPALI